MFESFQSISVGVAAFAVAVLYMIPSPIDPKPYTFNSTLPRLEGSLKVNAALTKVQKLFEGKVIGPESFAAASDGTMFTGTGDGKIWSFKGDKLELITRTGIDHVDCGSFKLEPECGRPKGMKVDKDGNLVLVDAYKGLIQVNLKTKQQKTLLSPNSDKLKEPVRFLNGLEIRKDGMIYFTDSSTKWDRRNYRYEVIETNNLGRLIEYNPKTDEVKVLLDGLYLANGLAFSPDESYLVIAEMSISKLTKYHLTGPLSGQSEVFTDNLPGYPDNVKLNSAGNFFVGLGSVKFEGSSYLGPFLDIIGPYPAIKRLLTKITPLSMFDIFLPRHAILLEVSPVGEIIKSYHEPTGTVLRAVGEGYEHNGNVYIGHFTLPFVGKISIKEFHDQV
ncbi:hypothetical protein SNE40_014807 [Patella caerulea]|uniref:Strictosidine synthase conserved region domain-containing protein n=2 Tax=Patella caerulea TaxID=87958 RepID=A0AAN8JIX2_PATCE